MFDDSPGRPADLRARRARSPTQHRRARRDHAWPGCGSVMCRDRVTHRLRPQCGVAGSAHELQKSAGGVQRDSLIAKREARQIRSPPLLGRCLTEFRIAARRGACAVWNTRIIELLRGGNPKRFGAAGVLAMDEIRPYPRVQSWRAVRALGPKYRAFGRDGRTQARWCMALLG